MRAEDIRNLVLVQSAGERRTNRATRHIAIDLGIEAFAVPDHVGATRFVASVTVRDREDGETLYRGLSACVVSADLDVRTAPPEMFPHVWPHLRSDLVSQCTRIAQQELSLPVKIPVETLEQMDVTETTE